MNDNSQKPSSAWRKPRQFYSNENVSSYLSYAIIFILYTKVWVALQTVELQGT